MAVVAFTFSISAYSNEWSDIRATMSGFQKVGRGMHRHYERGHTMSTDHEDYNAVESRTGI